MQDEQNERAWTWPVALATTALALWTPAIFGIAIDEDVRHAWHDVWFWPGLVPARYFSEEFYDSSLKWSTLLGLMLFTAAARWRRWVGVGGALLQGGLSLGYLMALQAI